MGPGVSLALTGPHVMLGTMCPSHRESITKDHISVRNMTFSDLLSSPLALSPTETQSRC